MLITREVLIKKLADKSGYYQKDIRDVLKALDDVVLECFNEVTEEESVSVQLITGCKIGCSIVPARDRVDPRTQKPIVCKPTCKPNSKFSQDFRKIIQQQYEEKEE